MIFSLWSKQRSEQILDLMTKPSPHPYVWLTASVPLSVRSRSPYLLFAYTFLLLTLPWLFSDSFLEMPSHMRSVGFSSAFSDVICGPSAVALCSQ